MYISEGFLNRSQEITLIFNNVAAHVDQIAALANECVKGGQDLKSFMTCIQPDIAYLTDLLESVDYSADFKASAHAFAIKVAEAYINDPVIDMTDEIWAYNDLQKVKSVTKTAQGIISDIQTQDPLWNSVMRGTNLVFKTAPPIYTRLDSRGRITCASHSVLAAAEDGTKMVDEITMNLHPANKRREVKTLWLSDHLHENFHGLEVMRSLAGAGSSASVDRTLFYKEGIIYDKVHALSHQLYEALPKERFAREVQAKFEARVGAELKMKKPQASFQPFFRR